MNGDGPEVTHFTPEPDRANPGQASQDSKVIDAYLRWVVTEKRHATNYLSSAELARRIADEPSFARKAVLTQRWLEAIERESTPDPGPELEARFKQAVHRFSEANGITYAAWRAMNVPAKVLAECGFRQTPAATTDKRDPAKRAQRRRMTPELAQEMLDIFNEAGGEQKVQGGSTFRGTIAVAEHYGYAPKYVTNKIGEARRVLAGGPRRSEKPSEASSPEPLAAYG